MEITSKQLASMYLEALEKADINRILDLFTDDAMVVSPLYGHMSAHDFYHRLFRDTLQSTVTLQEVFDQRSGEKMALFFNYKWERQNQKVVSFDVVDIMELEAGKIKKLIIVYDTFHTRLPLQD